MSDLNLHSRKLDSFSKRFNELLDKAGFPPIGEGRAKALADRFGGSKSGAQNWIGKDLPPKRSTLKLIISNLIAELKLNCQTQQVIAWLEHGNAVNNPFAEQSEFDISNLPIDSKHMLLSRIYIAVHNSAKSMGVDIYELDDAVMDHVYSGLIRQTIESGQGEPDANLVKSLLELATTSYLPVTE